MLYLTAIGADEKSAKMKASVFLHVVGEEALEVYNNFQFQDDADKMELDKILEKFEGYCIPKRNVTFERHRFFTCVQKTGHNAYDIRHRTWNSAHRWHITKTLHMPRLIVVFTSFYAFFFLAPEKKW